MTLVLLGLAFIFFCFQIEAIHKSEVARKTNPNAHPSLAGFAFCTILIVLAIVVRTV